MTAWMRSALASLIAPVLGMLISLLVGTLLLVLLGESPWVLAEALRTCLFTDFGLGYTLFYTTPLIFTGLAVALSFHCGLFNIGGEGQLYLGTLGIIVVAHFFPNLPFVAAFPLALLAALVGGGLCGGLAGWLKAYRGSHEVIVTILLNFVVLAFVNYAVMYWFRNLDVQNPETFVVGAGYHLPLLADTIGWFQSTPVNLSLFLALAAAGVCQALLFSSTHGFEMRSVGQSARASLFAGISVKRNQIAALTLSGALAGMVGINEVCGHQHKLIEGFSPQYGFTGIAVALLARNHPVGIVASAFLFGTLHNSARELEFLSERVSKELSLVLQGTLIAFIAAQYLYRRLWTRKGSA